MSRILFTIYAGSHRAFSDVTLRPWQAFAERHGYRLELALPSAGLPASWGKVAALRSAVARGDDALWVDADLLPIDISRDPLEHMPEWADQGFAFDDRLDHDVSASLWAVRARPEQAAFLDEVWEHRHPTRYGIGWEHGAIVEVLNTGIGVDRLYRFGSDWIDLQTALGPCFVHAGHEAGSVSNRVEHLRAVLAGASPRLVEAWPSELGTFPIDTLLDDGWRDPRLPDVGWTAG